jgi:hypothetical protein
MHHHSHSLTSFHFSLNILGKYRSKHTVSWEQDEKISAPLRNTLLHIRRSLGQANKYARQARTHTHIYTLAFIILEHTEVPVLSTDATRSFDFAIKDIRQLLTVNMSWWGRYQAGFYRQMNDVYKQVCSQDF